MYTRPLWASPKQRASCAAVTIAFRSGFVPLCAESVRERIAQWAEDCLPGFSLVRSRELCTVGVDQVVDWLCLLLDSHFAALVLTRVHSSALHCTACAGHSLSARLMLRCLGHLECRCDANPRVLSVQASSPECHTLLMQLQSKVSEHVELCAVLQVPSAAHAQACRRGRNKSGT
jgi:hypothetical protein